MELEVIDILLIVLYFLTVLVIGVISGRKESSEEYLISARRLNVISGISTMNATKTGAIIMAYTSLVFLYGVSAIWYFIGTFLGYLIFIPFAIRVYRQSKKKQYTLAEYFYKNYGSINGYLSNILTIIIMGGFLVVNLTAASKVFGFFTGMSFLKSTILIIIIIVAYLLLGGFSAVVKTDFIQYITIFAIIIITSLSLVFGNNSIGSFSFSILDFGFKNLASFLLLGIFFPFASPDLWQRVHAMPDTRTLKRSVLFSSFVYLIFGIILTYIALTVRSSFPSINPDIAFVKGLSAMLPYGLLGLLAVLLISAFMSSIDTYLYTSSSAYVQNFLYNKDKSVLRKNIRYAILIIGFLGMFLTLIIEDMVKSVYLTAFLVVLAIPVIVSWVKPSVRYNTLSFGFLFGILSLVIFLPFEFLSEKVDASIVLKAILGTVFGIVLGVFYNCFTRFWNKIKS